MDWGWLMDLSTRIPWAMQFLGLCKLGLGLVSPECQHRTQILWQLSIILL